jgi:hypothetical protein
MIEDLNGAGGLLNSFELLCVLFVELFRIFEAGI